jgi:hypothetical protein
MRNWSESFLSIMYLDQRFVVEFETPIRHDRSRNRFALKKLKQRDIDMSKNSNHAMIATQYLQISWNLPSILESRSSIRLVTGE